MKLDKKDKKNIRDVCHEKSMENNETMIKNYGLDLKEKK